MGVEEAYEELEEYFGTKNKEVRKRLLGDEFDSTNDYWSNDESEVFDEPDSLDAVEDTTDSLDVAEDSTDEEDVEEPEEEIEESE